MKYSTGIEEHFAVACIPQDLTSGDAARMPSVYG
jgi:hypothetical protein